MGTFGEAPVIYEWKCISYDPTVENAEGLHLAKVCASVSASSNGRTSESEPPELEAQRSAQSFADGQIIAHTNLSALEYRTLQWANWKQSFPRNTSKYRQRCSFFLPHEAGASADYL